MTGDIQTIDVGSDKQLFIDERFIASQSGVSLRVNQPRLAEAVLEPGPPDEWDDGAVGGYGQVLEVDGGYRQYFSCRSARSMAGEFDAGGDALLSLGCAESSDGVHWTKPNLGLFEYNGHARNNITCLDHGYVMVDPNAPPDQRYKLLCLGYAQLGAKDIFDALQPDTGGLYFYTSPDGLHWTWQGRRVLGVYPDTLNQIDYDSRIGRYVAYLRTWPAGFFRPKHTYGRAVGRLEIDDPLQPWPHQQAAKPFWPWGPRHIAGVSTEAPTVLAYPGYTDEGHWTDIYNPSVVRYPWADGVYLSFASLNHLAWESDIPNHSRLQIGMAVSRDGAAWSWPDTGPYVPFGPPGSGRSGMLFMHVGMVRRGDQIYQYHSGTDLEHHGQLGKLHGLEGCRNSGRLYRTVQRLDGFVSVDFPSSGGTVTTPPLRFEGRELHLNVNASGGEVRVAVLDESGRPMEAMAPDACDPISDNLVDRRVNWRGKSDVGKHSARPVRLRFAGRSSKLFALQFV